METLYIVLISIACTLAVATAFSFGIGYYIFLQAFARKPLSLYGDEENISAQREMINAARKKAVDELKNYPPFESITITSTDNLKLCAKLLRTNSKTVIICAHGYSSNPLREFSCITPLFYKHNFNTLWLDNRAHGDSEGRYIGMSALDRHDIVLWTKKVVELFGDDCNIILYGISMGASAICLSSALDLPPNVKGLVMDCGFSSPWPVLKIRLKNNSPLPSFFLYIANFFLRTKALYNLRDKKIWPINAIKHSKQPFLFVHGSSDDLTPCSMSKELFDACPSTDKQLEIIDDAEHVGSYYVATDFYQKTFLSFVEKHAQ